MTPPPIARPTCWPQNLAVGSASPLPSALCFGEGADEAVQPRRRRFSRLLRGGCCRTGQLERLLGDGGARGGGLLALAGELHGREGEFDAVGVKGFLDPEKG